jgi:hypothetical protein
MGDQVRLQTVPIGLGLNEQYFIGGMLMLRERLPRAVGYLCEHSRRDL